MWELAKNSITLFFKGKLFADPTKVVQQAALGTAVTTILLIVLIIVGVPVIVAAGVSGIVGGALQSYLFKDLRYR